MSDFSNNLRRLMEDRKLSQSDLARKSGVSKENISRYLRGQSYPELQNMLKLAESMLVSLAELDSSFLRSSESEGQYKNEPQAQVPASELPFVKRMQRMSPRRPIEAAIMDKLPLLPEDMLDELYTQIVVYLKSQKQTAENPQGEGK